MNNANIVYVSYDADYAGRKIGRAILADRPDQLKDASDRIKLGNDIVERWAREFDGIDYSSGGDQGVWAVPVEATSSLNQVRKDYEFATGLTVTIGIGKTLSESGKALLVGKFRGKNIVIQYEPSIEKEILKAQMDVKSGTASEEERKLSEAYLEPEGIIMKNEQAQSGHTDCPYCQASNAGQATDPNHCKYCHDTEQAEPCPYCTTPLAESEGAARDCPYCQNPTGDDCPYCKGGQHDPSVAGHPADCKYCAAKDQSAPVADANGGTAQQVTPTAGPTVRNPTTTNSENYAGQDLNQPDLPKPDAIQAHPDGLGIDTDAPTNENVKLDRQGQGGNNVTTSPNISNADPQSIETVQDIAQQVDTIPHYENSASKTVAQLDAADTATGTAVQANVSRPENYADANAPKDLGLGEDEQAPDVTSLMQEGLDNHADAINREKVIGLVSEALVGFKSCKGILEKAREQAPQLYASSIAMLKAMIEMCKMLGLDQEAQAPDSGNPLGDPQGTNSNPADGGIPAGGAVSGAGGGEQATAPQQGDPNSPIPKYAPKDSGANPEKKSEGAIGQTIGKLPTKATTEHVARTPFLPNAVNDKGQKKVIDPVVGRVRWIDMKEGKVKSDTGVPVKPGAIEEEENGPKIRDQR